jgi:hypothetical protein
LAVGARRLQEGSGAPNVIVSQAAAPVLARLEDRLVEVAGLCASSSANGWRSRDWR